MGVHNFSELLAHAGHNVEVHTYGLAGEPPVNVAVECLECSSVIIDFDRPVPAEEELVRQTG